MTVFFNIIWESNPIKIFDRITGFTGLNESNGLQLYRQEFVLKQKQ
jgi:hypothetical protein